MSLMSNEEPEPENVLCKVRLEPSIDPSNCFIAPLACLVVVTTLYLVIAPSLVATQCQLTAIGLSKPFRKGAKETKTEEAEKTEFNRQSVLEWLSKLMWNLG